MSDNVGKLRIGDTWVGLVGLEDTLREVRGLEFAEDGLRRRALLESVQRSNYVAPAATERYMDALSREYRRFLGEVIEEPAPSGLVVEVVGPGCPSCGELERRVMKALSDLGLPADFRHVRDAKEATARGVVRTPALVVGGIVAVAGRVPSAGEIRALLEGATREKKEIDHA